MNSKSRINIIAFNKYCLETADIYINNYSWYNMPPSVHKVLMHGGDIIGKAIVSIGHLSEEAQEATNKIYKRARLNNSRTTSRKDNNEDIIHFLLISSDPLISSLRKKEEARKEYINVDVQSLLI